MHQNCWRVCLCGLLIATGFAAQAQDVPGQEVPALEGLLPPKNAPERPRLLVLKTGQVVSGEMEPQVGGYMVLVPNGRVLITYDQVWTAATSLADAYTRLRDNRPNPSANERLELARWCFQHGLTEEARFEVAAALRLEPDRPEARQLLQRVEAALQKRPAVPHSEASVRSPVPTQVTPAALSGERTAEFIRVVQPILMNRCGNAACHGAATVSQFRMEPASGSRVSRLTSETNLAAVLQQIDWARPDESPLLTRPRSGTGPHRAAFQGRYATDQVETIRSWIRAVSREAGGTQEPPLPAPAGVPHPSPHPLVQAVAPFPRTEGAGAPLPASGETVPAKGVGSTPGPAATDGPRPVDEAFLRRILAESQPDPFDPDEFNRLIHGIEAGSRR
jgi:hypothetical protein